MRFSSDHEDVDELGMEAVAVYAACTSRDVSPDAAGGCTASPRHGIPARGVVLTYSA